MGIEERLEEIIKNDGVIELRGHHIYHFNRYINFLYGKELKFYVTDDGKAVVESSTSQGMLGHSTEEALETSLQFYRMLVENPRLKVKIVDAPDFDCKNICPRYREYKLLFKESDMISLLMAGLLVDEDKVCDGVLTLYSQIHDRDEATSYGLEVGRIYTAGELVELLKNTTGTP